MRNQIQPHLTIMTRQQTKAAVSLLLTLLSIDFLSGNRYASPSLGAWAFSWHCRLPPSPTNSFATVRASPYFLTGQRNNSRSRIRSIQLRATPDVSDPPTTPSSQKTTQSLRQLTHIEQYARLPIWPIWSGVLLFLTSRLFGTSIASNIEDFLGGRVCPNFFDAKQTSPFVLMVHHRHSFSNLDPIRFVQRLFFPEGFPSHPHRGFVTVTYCLRGGMIHRDSLGIKQSYGAEDRHDGAHVQWLTAGAGIQHEEMWDVAGDYFWWSDQELFQIWLNLPREYKMVKPKVELLRRHIVAEGQRRFPEGTTPIVEEEDGIVTTVVCGEYNGIRASVDCPTDASILRVQFTQHPSKRRMWKYALPKQHETAILYVRKGSVRVGSERLPAHHTGYLSREGEELILECEGEADVLLLSGEPLREPIASKGSMVMNTEREIQEAYLDYQRGFMGVPWSEKFSDSEWIEHVKRNPSKY
eukprot:CCRYP_001286-RE/>CCRYP_001286-RE protein AED:0.38 eAED:0.38 QI:104/1/1/1/0.33/0.25/4/405/468